MVKGDDGLIENNTIDGSTMSGISIGPEYYWNEADYPRRLTICGNLIRDTNYATNNFGRNGGLLIHGDGTRGNRDITIEGNRFDGVLGPNLIIEWAQGVRAGGACDTTLMQDGSGQIYAVMPKYDIFIRPIDLSRLPEGKVSWMGEEKKIVECKSGDTDLKVDPAYLEGLWVERVGGKYLLFYAELFRDNPDPADDGYWTGVAYADNPLGPWTKDRRCKVFEGGHVAIFDGPMSRKWISYRIEQARNRGLLAIDPFSSASALMARCKSSRRQRARRS